MERTLPEFLTWYGVFVVSGSFHEAAHAWSAWRCGDPTAREHGRMTLNPLVHIDFFGTLVIPVLNFFHGVIPFMWMKPVPVYTPNLRVPNRDSLFVSLAGPFSNLLLAFAAVTVAWGLAFFAGSAIPSEVFELLGQVTIINVFLAFFNLLPIPPLDGSTIVDYIRRDPNESYHAQAGLGMIILLAMIFLGLISYLVVAVYAAYHLLVSNPFVTLGLLVLFTAILVLFAVKNRPGGMILPRVKKEKKTSKEEAAVQADVARARTIVAAMAAGRMVSESDMSWYREFKADGGDGDELCARLSFDVKNDFCRRCVNLKRCVVRDAEDSAKKDT